MNLYINGNKIGDRFLSPGWTDYRKTCLYNTFDVTGSLTTGKNSSGHNCQATDSTILTGSVTENLSLHMALPK